MCPCALHHASRRLRLRHSYQSARDSHQGHAVEKPDLASDLASRLSNAALVLVLVPLAQTSDVMELGPELTVFGEPGFLGAADEQDFFAQRDL